MLINNLSETFTPPALESNQVFLMAKTKLFKASFGALGRNRTCDAGIFSPSLYQLSYRGIIQGTVYFRSNCLIKIAVGAFYVWRAEAVNLPSRDYSCILAETALHITRRIFSSISVGLLLPVRQLMVLLSAPFTRCILTHMENFTPRSLAPKASVH